MERTTKTKPKRFGFRHVVKRRGRKEKYDERKIYASVYESCHAAGLTTKQAEKISAKVSDTITKWAEKKDAMHAHEIHREVINALRKMDKDTAFMYEMHKNIC